jgi:hypothetical protein
MSVDKSIDLEALGAEQMAKNDNKSSTDTDAEDIISARTRKGAIIGVASAIGVIVIGEAEISLDSNLLFNSLNFQISNNNYFIDY